MRKRIASCLGVCILLLSCLALPAAAQEQSAAIRSAYFQAGTLYAFLSLPQGQTPEGTTVTAEINQAPAAGTFSLEAPQAGEMEYLLVVDAKMAENATALICAIAQGLWEQPNQEKRFSIAALTDSFQLIQKNLTTIEQVRSAVAQLPFSQSKTDICGGLSGTISHLRSLDHTPGGLRHVILVTPTLAADSDAAPLLETVIRKSPEVLLHSVRMTGGEGGVWDAVCAGRGIHTQATDSTSGYAEGRRIAAFAADLAMVRIPCVQETDSVALQLSLTRDGETTYPELLESIPNLDIKPIAAEKEIPLPSETGEAAPETVPPLMEAPEAIASAAPAAAPSQEPEPSSSLPLVIGGAAAAAVLVLVLLLVGRKPKQPQSQEGIPMQLEVISGSCKTSRRRFLLAQELVIGRSPSCDIVWRDASVQPRHCRIFLKDNLIWIEDLNERSDTALEGMKIYAPNRLRSEDEITMGATRFKMLF